MLPRGGAQRAAPGICGTCGRRFGCECHLEHAPTSRDALEARRPPSPGPEDCCQSSPKCEQCVWSVYDEELIDFHALTAAFDAQQSSDRGGAGGAGGGVVDVATRDRAMDRASHAEGS